MTTNVAVEDTLYLHMTDDGLPTGDDDMAVDGSSTPVPFWVAPPVDEKWIITRMIVSYRMSGTWTEVKYGSLTELTNGLLVYVAGGTTNKKDLLVGSGIKNNSNWSQHCYDAEIRSVGSGESFMAARWSFFKDSKTGLLLSGHRDERLVMEVQDALQTMTEHHVDVRGYRLR